MKRQDTLSLLPGVPRWAVAVALLATLAHPALCQYRYQVKYVPGSESGGQIELIQHQVDIAKKFDHIQRFLERYPTHEANDYLIEFLMVMNMQAEAWDKAILWGEKLMARHPEDLDTMYRLATVAERSGDPAKKAVYRQRLLSVAAATVAAKEAPKDISAETWAANQKLAKELLDQEETYTYISAVSEKDPRAKVRMCEAFQKAYPKSKYNEQIWPHLLAAYRAIGDHSKMIWAAEKMLATDPTDLDALLLVAQTSMESRANYAKVLANGGRILQIAPTKAPPANYSAEEWEKRKAYYIGTANLLMGNVFVNQNAFQSADRHLRAALNYYRTADQTQAGILFYLGWANYHLERYQEASVFFKQCMNIAGPFKEQAWKNVMAMKNERRIVE